MSDGISVKAEIITGIDLRHIDSRLDGIVLEAFEDHAAIMLKAIKKQWTGWRYVGRKKGDEFGRSQRAWKHELQATMGFREIRFINNAKEKGTGPMYAGAVARRKGATKEWKLVKENLEKNYIDNMVNDVTNKLIEQLNRAGNGKPRKHVIDNKPTSFTGSLTLIS